MAATVTEPTDTTPSQKTTLELLKAESIDREAIAKRFENLDLYGQIDEMLSLKAKAQAQLFGVCEANEPLTVAELIAEGESGTWIFEGVNTLPANRRFQKRVCPTEGNSEHLAGYNEQGLKWLTGPGCFTVRACREEEPGSIVFDYTIMPKEAPVGCKTVKHANKGLSRLVYGGMLDYMHRVSKNVMIGRAYKNGKATSNYFMLARGPKALK
ncbi:MAG: hypothetical protein ACYS22_03375 [Planctomycetota bacterium]|jgi:hypothetical protein